MERNELHSKLEIKLIDGWNAYVDRLLTMKPIEIVGKAAEIAAARFCYDELTENTAAYPEYLLEHLLGFNDPLEMTREQWILQRPHRVAVQNLIVQQALDAPVARSRMDEQCGDHSGDLEHALWSLWDHGPANEDLSMDGMN